MSPTDRREPRAILIGGGVAGIALGSKLKRDLGFENFTIYEREKAIGGTWYLNTYPGVGCDVDSHLYSFSFNPNPYWSKRFAEQKEILQYLNDTVDKFGVRSHIRTEIELVTAEWNEDKVVWQATFRDLTTGHTFLREAEILISCVGTISVPKDCNIPGVEKYKGTVFHSARWDHGFDFEGKTAVAVGNGCSAAQLVPHMIEACDKVYQFQRSAQWINERPNSEFTALQKWSFAYLPFVQRLYRFWIWKRTDALHTLYSSDKPSLIKERLRVTEEARQYMKSMAPEKYHDILLPTFPLGCKRRIFDPGYLESLHSDKIELSSEPIVEFYENGVRTKTRDIDADVVVLSTGFKIQEFLSPIKVIGREGKSINDHWKDTRGAQAYKATFVTGFPNLGIIFGPNAFPAHNSVIYTNEVQAEYVIKTIFRPLIMGYFKAIDVKESAETRDANEVQAKLGSMVWSGGCTNWNLDANGRNTTNYDGNTWKFWYALFWPIWKDFNITYDTGKRPLHPGWKLASTVLPLTAVGLLLASQPQNLRLHLR